MHFRQRWRIEIDQGFYERVMHLKEPKRLERAALLLPENLRRELLFLPEDVRENAEEVRLRLGQPLCLTVSGTVYPMRSGTVSADAIQETLERASQYSLHTVQESLREGFLTAPGGLRIGVGGSAVSRNGEMQGYRSVTSLNIRLPKSTDCVSPELYRALRRQSVLVYSEPGAGKTTFLRELVRLSSEDGMRASLIDERGEIAAISEDGAAFDVGRNTDVLAFCPKREAAERLLRTMSPQLLAMDELTVRENELLGQLRASGVCVLATVHADSRDDIRARGIRLDGFSRLVHITQEEGKRRYTVEEGEEC